MNGKKLVCASLIILVTMLVGIIVPSGIAAQARCNDISDHWAKDKISQWVNKGIVSGYGVGHLNR